MSKLERKYTYKHILIIVVLFVVAASVNLIPRTTTVSSPCKGGGSTSQAVKVTSRGWPFVYTKKYEATKICLVFEKGKFKNTADQQPGQELNIWALLANEALLLLVVGGLLVLVGRMKGKNRE